MPYNFQIQGLPLQQFKPLFEYTDEKLATMNACWVTADSEPGFPCRISLMDAKRGERLLALTFCHHAVNSPYRASGPIFVRENAVQNDLDVNQVPDLLLHRLVSVRAYDANGFMLDCEVAAGNELSSFIQRFFDNSQCTYLHLHNARPGCFICTVIRA